PVNRAGAFRPTYSGRGMDAGTIRGGDIRPGSTCVMVKESTDSPGRSGNALLAGATSRKEDHDRAGRTGAVGLVPRAPAGRGRGRLPEPSPAGPVRHS